MKYFTEEEFKCKCGCGEGEMDESLLSHLDYAREVAGVPFTITSGYRCKEHNAKVGGKATSSHLVGKAVDIKATDSRSRYCILGALYAAGFNRIGIHPDFIHVDNDHTKSEEVAWLYQR